MNRGIHLGFRLEQRLEQRLEISPTPTHSPIRNPELTRMAQRRDYGSRPTDEVDTEIELLQRFKHDWKGYLDAPLIVHADAALTLKRKGYDGVVSVMAAGVPYGDIFEIMGYNHSKIDYSHHKRKMDVPIIEQTDLEALREMNKVVVADIDMVSGKTARVVTDYLRENGVNVGGVYLGLSRWPGIKMKEPQLGRGKFNSNKIWNESDNGLSEMETSIPGIEEIIPPQVEVFRPNPKLWCKRSFFSSQQDNLKYAVHRVKRRLN
ncbi:MAG: phosphoribosyltransferase [Nanoarchaeota archaeon]